MGYAAQSKAKALRQLVVLSVQPQGHERAPQHAAGARADSCTEYARTAREDRHKLINKGVPDRVREQKSASIHVVQLEAK